MENHVVLFSYIVSRVDNWRL